MSYLRNYREGMLLGYRYACSELAKLKDRKAELETILGGHVRSPSIRSLEEAKYQRGTPVYRNEIADLDEELEEVNRMISEFSRHVQSVNEFMQTLSNEDARLIRERYFRGRSLEQISAQQNMAVNTVWRHIESALES